MSPCVCLRSLGIMFNKSRASRTHSLEKQWHLREENKHYQGRMLRKDDWRVRREMRRGFYQRSQENSFKKEGIGDDRYYMKSSSKTRVTGLLSLSIYRWSMTYWGQFYSCGGDKSQIAIWETHMNVLPKALPIGKHLG